MKGIFVFLVAVYFATPIRGPLHASCKISWIWGENCDEVKTAIVDQIHKWTSGDNCPEGKPGEKCYYTLKNVTENQIFATHKTPVKHYVDDLTFTFGKNGSEICMVQGYSTSETWYAVLDYGTNYCNLHNLITGAGLDKVSKYSETTNDKICTEYTSADCKKY